MCVIKDEPKQVGYDEGTTANEDEVVFPRIRFGSKISGRNVVIN